MTDTGKDVSVVDQRKEFLKKLAQDIDIAFQNRHIVDLIPTKGGGGTTKDNAAEAENEAKNIRSAVINNKSLIIENSPISANHVWVSNSHDYKELLSLAYEKINMKSADIPRLVEDTLRHEYAHMVPVIGESGVNLKYAVAFFEDPAQGLLGMQPIVILSGKLSIEKYKQFISGPHDLSTADAIRNNAFTLPFHLKVVRALKGFRRKP